jgi:hypothetical protein
MNLPVWDGSWQEVWHPLSKSSMVPEDLFVDLIGGLVNPQPRPIPPAPPAVTAFDDEGVLIDPIALSAHKEYEDAIESTLNRSDYESALTSEAIAKSLVLVSLSLMLASFTPM